MVYYLQIFWGSNNHPQPRILGGVVEPTPLVPLPWQGRGKILKRGASPLLNIPVARGGESLMTTPRNITTLNNWGKTVTLVVVSVNILVEGLLSKVGVFGRGN